MKKVLHKMSVLCLMLMTIILISLCQKTNVYAAGLTVSSDKTKATIGEQVSITVSCPENYLATIEVSYDSSILERVSGGTVGSSGLGINLGTQGITSATFVFKTKAEGTATVTMKPTTVTNASNFQQDNSFTAVSVSITVAQPVVVKSNNNRLSSLSFSEGTISPDFSGDVNNYEMEVLYSVENLDVYTSLSSDSAYVDSISGNKNLQVGENFIYIKVIAENGEARTYTIFVKRLKEGQEIGAPEVDENDVKFSYKDNTYISEKEAIPIVDFPESFVASVVNVEGVEYPCLQNKDKNLVVMYLYQEGKKDGALYFYNVDTKEIEPFVYLLHGNNYVVVMPLGYIKSAPEGYSSVELSVQEGLITAFAKEGSEEEKNGLYLIYCLNSNNEYGWYQYDSKEGTYQRYFVESTVDIDTEKNGDTITPATDNSAINKLQKMNMFFKILLVGAAGIILILVIILIIVASLKKSKSGDDFDEDDDEYEENGSDESDEYEETDEYDEYDDDSDDDVADSVDEDIYDEDDKEEVEKEAPSKNQNVISPIEKEYIRKESEEVKVEPQVEAEQLSSFLSDEDDYKKGYSEPEDEKEDGDFTFIDL